MLNRIRTVPVFGVRRVAGGLAIAIAGEVRTAGGLSRVMRWIEGEQGFLAITTFRRSNSFAQNRALFTRLPGELRHMLGTVKVGAYWMIGHWAECSVEMPPGAASLVEGCRAAGGSLKDQLEYSWFFVQPSGVDGKAWLRAGTRLAETYAQDAFILRQTGGEAGLHDKGGALLDTLGTAGAVSQGLQLLTWMRAHSDTYGYSELRHLREHGRLQPIVFTSSPQAEGGGAASSRQARAGYGVADASPADTAWGEPHGPGAVAFYAATPHNNAAGRYLAALGVTSG